MLVQPSGRGDDDGGVNEAIKLVIETLTAELPKTTAAPVSKVSLQTPSSTVKTRRSNSCRGDATTGVQSVLRAPSRDREWNGVPS